MISIPSIPNLHICSFSVKGVILFSLLSVKNPRFQPRREHHTQGPLNLEPPL